MTLAIVLFFVTGLIQLNAIWAGLGLAFGFSGFGGLIISFLLGYLPLIGTSLGIWGAIYAWGWQWYWAVFLFLGTGILIPLALTYSQKQLNNET